MSKLQTPVWFIASPLPQLMWDAGQSPELGEGVWRSSPRTHLPTWLCHWLPFQCGVLTPRSGAVGRKGLRGRNSLTFKHLLLVGVFGGSVEILLSRWIYCLRLLDTVLL